MIWECWVWKGTTREITNIRQKASLRDAFVNVSNLDILSWFEPESFCSPYKTTLFCSELGRDIESLINNYTRSKTVIRWEGVSPPHETRNDSKSFIYLWFESVECGRGRSEKLRIKDKRHRFAMPLSMWVIWIYWRDSNRRAFVHPTKQCCFAGTSKV